MERPIKKIIWEDESELSAGGRCLELVAKEISGDRWIVAHFDDGTRSEYNTRHICVIQYGKFEV